ncbi:HD domain-containing phosphohydrolase [Thermodesulfatator atlanticus]|uniref:HD domain-containing phosphohydrolase n=1 Tax=Thermodesulfatator atlanticus TaxID=501497 RepID=UPI0003B7B7DE|nr:HD domain-containing phosphohydrolase [Thermodesulfatator atlanticus]
MSKEQNILIVDDEALLRENLSLILSSSGNYQVYQAKDAYEALEIVNKYPIDLVLLDVNMPGISGIDFLKLIRKDGFSAPVILMTSYPSLELTVEALREGASDFLIKPFTSQQLFATLKRFKNNHKKPSDDYKDLVKLLKKKTQEQTILFTISDKLTTCDSLNNLYQEIVKLSKEFTLSDEAILYLIDLEKDLLIPEAWEGFSKKPATISLKDNNPISKSARENLPYLIPKRPPEKALLTKPFYIKLEIIGVLVLLRKENFTKDDLFIANLVLERSAPLVENFILRESLILNLYDALRALVRALEAKDPYTKQHSERVTQYALAIAKEMGLAEDMCESLRFAGHLHDVGKVGVPDAILLKPGRLAPEEYEIIKQHPLIGAEIVGHMGLLSDEAQIIKHHHERWDGNGYPYGLAREDIPLLSRILAVADTFDAMTSVRPYRPARSFDDAFAEIVRCAGSQFDPQVVDAFKACFPKILELYQEEESEEGSLSQIVA